MSCNSRQSAGLDPGELRDSLFELWNQKDLQTMRLKAMQGFSALPQPLDDLLTILQACPGKQKGRSHTLGHHVLLDFQTWLKDHPEVTLSSLPEQQASELQRRALGLMAEAVPSSVDVLIGVYQLQSMEPELLRCHVRRLQDLRCYKEAAVLGMKLQLQPDLGMEEMCVPLILQNKLPLAESFVSGHRRLEEELVAMLDSWCQPGFTVDHISSRFPAACLSKHCLDLLQPKMLTKQVFRLVDKFSIDPGLCSNALHKRRLDSLRYLMYARFVEKSMTEENWCDHVQYVVADDQELQVHLLEMLVKHCSLQTAAQWSLHYSVPRDRLPFGVWEVQQSLPPHLRQLSLADSTQTQDWTASPSHRDRFYQVPLTRDRVQFVDSLETLRSCRDVVLQDGSVVGVDMEWQPTFGCTSSQQVALIQLAVSDRVFLLDLQADGLSQHPDTVAFVRSLFSHPDVLKLGYGMSGDLKCVSATWPQFSEEPLAARGMLDLANLHQKIQQSKVLRTRDRPREVLVGEDSSEKGLSLLVLQVLGRPLDKREQLSNWNKRPLRPSQVRYAVTDAYCLLAVYMVLSADPASFGLPADLRGAVGSGGGGGGPLQRPERSRDKKQKKAAAVQDLECQGAAGVEPPRPHPRHGGGGGGGGGGGSPLSGREPPQLPPIPPQQLRVVCDNMLQGLGRYLRCLGVDVLMLENTDDHRVAATLAREDGRVILTCGQPFQSLRSQVAEGRCLALDCSEKARDQAVRVLRHFNVQPTTSDIFSRCQACNSDQYVAMPRKDMVRLLQQKGFLENDWDDDGDEGSTSEVTSDPPRYAPQCQWAPLSDLDPDTLAFPGGAPIQLHTVPLGLLPRIPHFYVCTRCGKVFWEGSHFERVLALFQGVLNVADGEDEAD
ncbi:exonuclease mut-7 homolog [Nelusetta ayraudi]|uniref:exonuclease mut-7 homolog n=1 Tax=Nelusetta ayraudi TaxID=303726 RepID=UPI003F72E9CA